MPSLLQIYNDALREFSGGPLADTTTPNPQLLELSNAFTPAVAYVLTQADWNFAMRRATLTGVADTATFPPFTYRYAKPADYLRKHWIKIDAADEFPIDHAEAAVTYFFGYETAALIEYVSGHADSYNPVYWPPQFAKVVSIYLAHLTAPKLARAGDDVVGTLWSKFQGTLAEASEQEAVFYINQSIAANRLPVMRRAMEFMGQQLAGSIAVYAHTDKLRWQMQKAWEHAVRYCLEQGAWNFATKRAVLEDGEDAATQLGSDFGIIEGYSVSGDSEDTTLDQSLAGYTYAYTLPEDFLTKVWIKRDANLEDEIKHQIIRNLILIDEDPAILEYIAEDSYTTDPGVWPASFMETVASYLALMVAPELVVEQSAKGRMKVSAPQIRDKLEGIHQGKLSDAKMKDAVQQFPKRIPAGSFVRARMGGTYSGRRH